MGSQVAIIVPVYQAHDTIKALLHSIAAQTQVDICKIIIIDDADSTPYDYLYEAFPSLDMVILRNETNMGPGAARNKGIEKAIALDIPYLMFADADDQIYNCLAVEMLVSTLLDNEVDLVCGAFYEELEGVLSIHEDFDIWLFGKIYRTNIIKDHNIRFPLVGINEDVCFNLHYWIGSGAKNQIKEILYLWKNNPNSITRKNNHVYTQTSFAPLCRNLAITYEAIMEDSAISEEQILLSLPNRIIRMFLGYNRYLTDPEAKPYLEDMMDALKELNKKVFEHYWSKITATMLTEAWMEILQEGMPDYVPNLSIHEFIKKIREE